MLVVTCKVGHSIKIGEHIEVTLVENSPGQARIGIAAPKEVPIIRDNAVVRTRKD